MAEQLTEEQKCAVFDRGGRLLVSAAAGSGKTKVLVDRLMSYLIDPVHPANIDDFLIITYTKAAASELRGKIASKLSDAIAQSAGNTHLLQQLQRLHLTKISTVHSFCADILREYAYMLDITSDFRVADEEECNALRMRALESVLDSAYSGDSDEKFYAFIDSQGFGRDDRRVPEIILQVYNAAKCHLNPDVWLDWCAGVQELSAVTDMSETVWGKYLIESLHNYLDLQISTLNRCIEAATLSGEMDKPAALLRDTVEQLRCLRNCEKWDDICDHSNIDFGRLSFSKKCTDIELIDQIKAVRDACKAGITKKTVAFCDKSDVVLQDYRDTLISAQGLIDLVRKFESAYSKLKQAKRVLDFADLEHKTLDLLLGKHRSGATRIAAELAQRFREVMVDEYQDSNAVQDAIFTVITEQKKNCFMVGDVKQSIYQFRLADPSIFIEKYNRYISAVDAQPGQGRKVVLSKNFRSSGAVIQAVNDVFQTCMSADVGGLTYGEAEALYEGVPHIPVNEPEVELYGIDVVQDTYQEEATFVADKIAELLDGKHMIRHGDALRPIKPEDVVILLRSPGSVGSSYQLALERKGIPCASLAGQDLLRTEEVETLCSLLKVINNPLVDIPLTSILLSRVFGFTANELAEIRKHKKYGTIYSALTVSESEKVKEFLNTVTDLRKAAQLRSLSQLLLYIFSTTRIDSIYSAMPDGSIRTDNLQQFCQIANAFENNSNGGLSKFIDYLDTLSERGLPISSSEQATDAVTIMSIHKSKGLEFPVVFLCGLARDFNMESTRSQVLCDKELGLGLNCVDISNRIQYPSIAKKAIAAKIRAESISEEMRVLYVAMTRAKDRLIMTYSVKNVADEMNEISLRMAFSDPLLLTSTAYCPGTWILITANTRRSDSWRMNVVSASSSKDEKVCEHTLKAVADTALTDKLKESLAFQYAYKTMTQTPSKQTATQMKGREKDRQAAENADIPIRRSRIWRKPAFVSDSATGTAHGTAMHMVMQYISFKHCDSVERIKCEIRRLVTENYITEQQAASVNAGEIAAFFATDIGKRVRTCKSVLREFKFSVLAAADLAISDPADSILLQGVVDCAIIEDDGIIVIDFKSDRITQNELPKAFTQYSQQVKTYADALSRIYQLPVKNAMLYFFCVGTFMDVI